VSQLPDQCDQTPPNPEEVEDQYPENSNPEVRIPSLSALCSYGMTPLVMQGALRQTLMQHFANPDNILNKTLRNALRRDGVWNPGATTGIAIESIHKWRPELTESRPGIVLQEGEWQWRRMGIGDQAGKDYRSGRQFFGGLWQGTHTLFAVHNYGAEAQILAWEVAKILLWFSREIEKSLGLHRFIPVSVGKVSALQESTENYVAPIVVAYVVADSWYLQEEAPRLKRIVFRTNEMLAQY